MIKETLEVMAPIAKNVPEELTERWQWVLWRLEERDGKLRKVPCTPPTGRLASVTDLMSWSTFQSVLAAFERGGYDGIGFMFSSGDPFVGIDLDKCRNPETHEISAWAQEIISRVQEGYIEVSPSGTGIHVILEGKVRGGGMRKKVRVNEEVVGEIELYSRERFFAITGDVLR
jgi:primase-polymerase (primpol)-like protein